VPRAGRAPTRVVCNPLGLSHKGEEVGHQPLLTLTV